MASGLEEPTALLVATVKGLAFLSLSLMVVVISKLGCKETVAGGGIIAGAPIKLRFLVVKRA